MVAAANTGLSVPLLRVKCARVALEDGARVAVMIYVLVVTPSCAVTTILITLAPTLSGMAPVAAPEATAVPFTFIVALASVVTEVTVRLLSLLGTEVV